MFSSLQEDINLFTERSEEYLFSSLQEDINLFKERSVEYLFSSLQEDINLFTERSEEYLFEIVEFLRGSDTSFLQAPLLVYLYNSHGFVINTLKVYSARGCFSGDTIF